MHNKLPLLLSLSLGGCDVISHDCNLMYAPDFVQVDLEADSWTAGEWSVEADGESCTITLPGDEADVVCSGEALSIALTEDGAGLAALALFDSAPDSFEIVLSRDGAEVFSVTVSPTYTEDEPNGEGCGFRRSGSATVEVDAG